MKNACLESWVVGQLVVLTLVVAVACAAESQSGAVLDAVTRNLKHLRQVANQRSLPDHDVGDELKLYLDRLDDHAPSCDEMRAIMSRISDIGLCPTGWTVSDILMQSGFYEDAIVTEIMVAALRDDCHDIPHYATINLEQHARDRDLARFTEVLRARCYALGSNCPFRLFARVATSEGDRQYILSHAAGSVGDDVRARIGDQEAEARLIARFTNETTFVKKVRLASALGYVGSHNAGLALAKELKSSMFAEPNPTATIPGWTSLRIAIIQALGRIHQDNHLLTSELQRIIGATARDRRHAGDAWYGGPTAVQNYLDLVCAWARSTYGIALDAPDPPPRLFARQLIPIGR